MAEEGGGGPEQLAVEIVADDKTERVLEAVRAGFESLTRQEDNQKKAVQQHGAETSRMGEATIGFFRRIGEEAFLQIKEAAMAVPEGIHAAFDAAIEESEQIRELADTFTLLSKGTASFDELSDSAAVLHDELEQVGIVAYASADAINSAYTELLYQSEEGAEATRKLVEEMANASRIVPGGLAEMTRGMQALEYGVIRARNPIVQLIAATDVMKGNAKQVAAELQKMAPEEQLEKAREAIERMAEKAATLPPSFRELKQQIADIRSNAFEELGHRIEDSLMPELKRFADWLADHQDDVNRVASNIGQIVGDNLGRVLEDADAAFQELVNPSADMLATWQEVAELVKTSADAMRAAVGGAKDLAKDMTNLTSAVTGGSDAALLTAFGGKFTNADDDYVRQMRAAIVGKKPTEFLGDNVLKMLDVFAVGETSQDNYGERNAAFDEALRKRRTNYAAYTEPLIAAGDEAIAARGQPRADYEAMATDAANRFATVWNRASQTNDAEAKKWIAQFLSMNDDIKDAFFLAMPKLEGGFGAFASVLRSINPELAQSVSNLSRAATIKSTPPVHNFYGGIHIQQDFKGETDPSRIVAVMRDDLFKQTEARTQPRGATPFGV